MMALLQFLFFTASNVIYILVHGFDGPGLA
jgi:hypothetical protein